MTSCIPGKLWLDFWKTGRQTLFMLVVQLKHSHVFKVGQRCYYLLVVFGCGVLFLFIHSSQPRFSPGVGAGAAQWLVCCTLSAGIVSKYNTMLLNLACVFLFLFLCSIGRERGKKRWILTLTICHAEKQRRNRVSSIAQQHSMRTKLCEKPFCCGEIQIYLLDKMKQRLGSEISPILRQKRTKTSKWIITVCSEALGLRGRQCMQKWDIIHPNTAPSGFTQVKPPWWAQLIIPNRRLPCKCQRHKDDIMKSEDRSISCVTSQRVTSDNRLIADCPGRFFLWLLRWRTAKFSISLSNLAIMQHLEELCLLFCWIFPCLSVAIINQHWIY